MMNKLNVVRRIKHFSERNRLSGGNLIKKNVRQFTAKLLLYVVLLSICFLILQPIISLVPVTFMGENDLMDITVILIPKEFTTQSYKIVIDSIDYLRCLWNSLWTSTVIAIAQVVSCTLVGFGFARYKFPLKKIWFTCVILLIIIPPQTISTSLYLSFTKFDILGIFTLIFGEPLNLRSSIVPYFIMSLTCTGLRNGLFIYLIRQYFRNVPKELEEAAYIDGCGALKTFYKILLPDAKAITSTCFFFAFIWQWTDMVFVPLFFQDMFLLSTKCNASKALDQFLYNNGFMTGTYDYESMGVFLGSLEAVTSVLIAVPLILIYVYVQRFLVESLSSTGIKM